MGHEMETEVKQVFMGILCILDITNVMILHSVYSCITDTSNRPQHDTLNPIP